MATSQELAPAEVGGVISSARGTRELPRSALPLFASTVLDGVVPLAYKRIRKTVSLWARAAPERMGRLQPLDPMPEPVVDAIALYPGERRSKRMIAAATTSAYDEPTAKLTDDMSKAPHLWPLYGLVHVRAPIHLFLLVAREEGVMETLEGQCKLVLSEYWYEVKEGTQQFVAIVSEGTESSWRGRVRGWVTTPKGLHYLGESFL